MIRRMLIPLVAAAAVLVAVPPPGLAQETAKPDAGPRRPPNAADRKA